jgi:hypothetical protein
MLNVQRCFVNWRLLIDELENNIFENDKFENDDENLFNEIVDNKCDNEIIIHVFSQFKKKHVVNAFSCYDVLIFDEKHFRFVRYQAEIVQLIKIDQIQKTLRNVKRVRKENIDSLNVDFVCDSYRILLDDRRRLVEIIHTNEFQVKRVRDKNRSISYVVLRTNHV